jgi:imidazolonepropionase
MHHKPWDMLWINAALATCEEENRFLENGALAVQDGRIVWVGDAKALPDKPDALAATVIDAQGTLLTPGLIDCHTHLVYAGNRAREFELRLQGVSYQEIAAQGGGIQSTVTATRQASEQMIFAQSIKRARALVASGVTTLEIKSGYGLNLETEMKLLRVAKRIEDALGVTVKKTFLGAHSIPKEYREKPDDYVTLVCEQMIPMIAKEKLADAVDVFCEGIAFSPAQMTQIFQVAKANQLAVKCHAEQLSNIGASKIAAQYQAMSVDHLEHADVEAIKAIAAAKTIAVLLPGAFYYLREKNLPPIHLLQQHHVPIAIASDSNPGTSPVTSLPLIMNMACVLFQLTPAAVLMGVTLNAAKALRLEKTHGTLTIGKQADFVVWDVKQVAETCYAIGGGAIKYIYKNGQQLIL